VLQRALIKHHVSTLNEIQALLPEFQFRLRQRARAASKAATKDHAHMVHEDQSLAIVPLSTDNMTDIGLPHASYNQGTLIQQHPQAIATSNG
jgi:hypothetical protein